MADVIRMPVNVNSQAQCFSSSLLASFSSSKNSPQPSLPPKSASHKRVFSLYQFSSSSAADLLPCSHSRPRKQLLSFKMHATVTETHQPKWWEKNVGPNMIDIHSTEEFFAALSHAGDRLVIVEFYGTWCASCRALFPKLCRTAAGHPETLFLKVNFDENKSMCKQLNVKVLPYFHFYRGADKQLESFSCSLAKFQKIKDAIKLHTTAGCSLGTTKDTGSSSAEETRTESALDIWMS